MIDTKRKDLCTPSATGLFPDEILMLHYADSYTNSQNYFQNFWSFRYGVDNPQELLNSLSGSGYIELGNVADALQDESVKSLKEILTAKGLKATGKKADLIARIINTCDTNELSAQFPERRYKLTPKGEAELSTNEYVVFIHRKQYDDIGLNIYSLNQLLAQQNTTDYKSAIIQFLLNKEKPSYYTAAILLIEDNKHAEALPYLCTDLYVFLSGVFQPECTHGISLALANAISHYDNSIFRIPSGRLSPLREVINKLDINNSQLHEYLVNLFAQISIQQHLFFTDNECANIIIMELDERYGDLKLLYTEAAMRYIARLKNE